MDTSKNLLFRPQVQLGNANLGYLTLASYIPNEDVERKKAHHIEKTTIIFS